MLLVGTTESRGFRIPETVLKARSDYFEGALSVAARDPAWFNIKVLPFPDLESSIVETWYRIIHNDETVDPPIDLNAKFAWFTKLYVVGEHFKDTTFRAQVMVELRKVFDNSATFLPLNDAIDIIYKGTPSASPARKLLVEKVVSRWKGDIPAGYKQDTHPIFLTELLCEYAKQKSEQQRRPESIHIPSFNGPGSFVPRNRSEEHHATSPSFGRSLGAPDELACCKSYGKNYQCQCYYAWRARELAKCHWIGDGSGRAVTYYY